ncbi:MAG: glycosyltransferase family 1 protein [Terriglobia bacterium]|jgi:glycosyltransferase involved in cell wall biosynthesis
MKVVIFATATPSVGGIGQYIQELLPRIIPLLITRGCQVTVLLSKDSPLGLSMNGLRKVRLPANRANRQLRVLWEHAYAAVLGWGADVFVSLESRLPTVPIRARRFLVVIHDVYPFLEHLEPERYPVEHTRLKGFYWRLVVRKAVMKADRIITDSNSAAGDLKRVFGVPDDRVTTIYAGIDHERFRLLRGAQSVKDVRTRYHLPEAFYLYVSGLGARKNFRLIVETYARARLDPRIRLPVVVTSEKPQGERPHTTIKLIEDGGQTDLFRFIGHVPDDELSSLYAASQALLYPSFYEGFGLPPVEAMACGTPVIASNRASLPEVVGDAAFAIDPDYPESLIEALYKANVDSARNNMIEKGLKRAQDFSWESTAEKTAHEILALNTQGLG